MSELNQLHLIVEGHVQGVGFRYFVQEKANSLGLTGWVRNLLDDRVEILAEGKKEKLDQLFSAATHGPSRAMVTEFVVEWAIASNEFNKFNISPTY